MNRKKTFTDWTHTAATFGVFIACLACAAGAVMLFLSTVEPRNGYGIFSAILLGSGFGALLLSCMAGTVAEISMRLQGKATDTTGDNEHKRSRKTTSFDRAMLEFDE